MLLVGRWKHMGWAVGGGDFCLVLSQNPHVGTQRSILGDSRPPALSNWDSLGLEGEGKLGTWDKLWTRPPTAAMPQD